jgi:hypothetical protein
VLILPGYGEVPPVPQGQGQATRGPYPRPRSRSGRPRPWPDRSRPWPDRSRRGGLSLAQGPFAGATTRRDPVRRRRQGGPDGVPSDCRVAGLPDRSNCQLARRAAGPPQDQDRTPRQRAGPPRDGAPSRPSKEPSN